MAYYECSAYSCLKTKANISYSVSSVYQTTAGWPAAGFLNSVMDALAARPLNALVVGETGSGKSSIINAIMGKEVAPPGMTCNPETMEITPYQLSGLTLWDTPGFGNGSNQDAQTVAAITDKFKETGDDGAPMIDLVLLVADGTAKNLTTVYDTLDTVMPLLGEDADKRIIFAINKMELAAENQLGRDVITKAIVNTRAYFANWNIHTDNKDEQEARENVSTLFRTIAASFRERIKENSGIELDPICCIASPFNSGYWKPFNVLEIYRRMIMFNIAENRPAARAIGGK